MIKDLEFQSSQKSLAFFFIAIPVTTFLFYFMGLLISGGQKIDRSKDSENFIEFVRIKKISQTEVKKRKLPKKPEIQNQPRPTKSIKINKQSVEPNRTQPKFNTPKLDVPLALGSGGMGVATGGGANSGDSQEMPLVRVEPQFPRDAALKGIEKGWVRVEFDLQTDGTVSDVRIVDSSPRNIFDMAARRAILKWKYRPKMIDGKTVKRKGLKVQLDFEMAK